MSFLITPGERNKKSGTFTLKELIEEVKSQDKLDDSVDFRKMLVESYHNREIPRKSRDKLGIHLHLDGSSYNFLERELKRVPKKVF